MLEIAYQQYMMGWQQGEIVLIKVSGKCQWIGSVMEEGLISCLCTYLYGKNSDSDDVKNDRRLVAIWYKRKNVQDCNIAAPHMIDSDND